MFTSLVLSNIAYENACFKSVKAISGYLEPISNTLLYSLVISVINVIILSFIKSVYFILQPVVFSIFGSVPISILIVSSLVGSGTSIF